MKKLFYIGALSALLLAACGDAEKPIPEDKVIEQPKLADKTVEVSKQDSNDKAKGDTVEAKIEKDVTGIVKADFSNTDVKNIEITNYQMEENKFIVSANLVWNTKNNKDTTKEMLKMYSDHLAATLYDNERIYEVVVYWEVPHHLENDNALKYSYERTSNGMAISDEWVAPVLQ